MRELIAKELALANTFLADANLLLSGGCSARSVANRVYYAAFHAARAYLTKLGFEPKTHRGTISLFWIEVANKEG